MRCVGDGVRDMLLETHVARAVKKQAICVVPVIGVSLPMVLFVDQDGRNRNTREVYIPSQYRPLRYVMVWTSSQAPGRPLTVFSAAITILGYCKSKYFVPKRRVAW